MNDNLDVEYAFEISHLFVLPLPASIEYPLPERIPVNFPTKSETAGWALIQGNVYVANLPASIVERLDASDLAYFAKTETLETGLRRLKAICVSEP